MEVFTMSEHSLTRQAMEAAIARAADAVTCLLSQGVDQAMARYNG